MPVHTESGGTLEQLHEVVLCAQTVASFHIKVGVDVDVGVSYTTIHVVTYLFGFITIVSSGGTGTRINVEKNDNKIHLEIKASSVHFTRAVLYLTVCFLAAACNGRAVTDLTLMHGNNAGEK